MNEDKYINELVTTCNIFELTQLVILKIGLEHLAPLPQDKLNEIISAVILEKARS